MAVFALSLSVLLLTLNVGYVGSSCNGETMYVQMKSHVVVSCPINLDYLAVCWYLHDSHGHPLSCIEGGKITFRDGYSISDQGALIIDTLHEEHVGVYIIEIIDSGGSIHNMNITIDIKVSVESKPTIVDCSSSVHEICGDVDGEKRQVTLVCIAGPAKPPVPISWSSYDGTHQPSVDRNNQNTSTSLYTSISLLEYDPNNYLFEYFTCDVTGEAAAQNTTAVIFKKGNKDIDADDQNTKYVISGDDLSIGCSEFATHPMSEWGIVYPNKSFHLLWRKYPGYQAGSCGDGNDCEVHTDGSLHVTDVTYIKEGHYVCTYSNSVSEGVRDIPVEVLVSPAPGMTVIKGCEKNKENNECELNVANIGSIECSILGSRPSVKPNIIVNKTAVDIYVFLFDDERESLEGTVSGTFDTIHKVNYEIPECSGVVRVDCVPDDSMHKEKLLKSYAKLITATSNCDESRGKPGLAAFIVILVLALIVAVVFMILKRDHVPRFISSGYKKTPQDEEVGSGTGYSSSKQESKGEDTATKLSELIQMSFDEALQPILHSAINKQTKTIDFEEMIVTFCEDQKVSDPLPHLFKFLRSKTTSLKEEDAMAILKYILNNLPLKWISSFLKGLAGDLRDGNVSSTNYISLIGEAYRTEMIDIGQYVELTGTLLQKDSITFEITFDDIMNELKRFFEEKHCSKEEFADSILQCYRRNYISDDRLIEEVCSESLSFGFAFPYVLQSLYQLCKKKTDIKSSQLFELFKKIWTKKMGEEKPFGPLAVDDKNPTEAFRNSLINAYLFSYNSGLVNHTTTVSLIERTEINQNELNNLLGIFLHSEIVNSDDIATDLLMACISKNLISEDIYLISLRVMLINETISIDEFKTIIRNAMEEKWLSERSFEESMTKEIKRQIGKERDWIIFVTEMTKKNMIGAGVQKNLFQAVINQHEMKRDEVKSILYDCGMSKEEKNIFLEKLKFH